jgi:hypothetical protein
MGAARGVPRPAVVAGAVVAISLILAPVNSAPAAAYRRIDEATVHSTLLTRGPWNPDHQHGGPPIALVCGAIERVARDHGFENISRLTANLIRPVPIGVLSIKVGVDYVGRNAGHLSAQLIAESKEVGRFTALAQRAVQVDLPSTLRGHEQPHLPPLPDQVAETHFPFETGDQSYAHLVETRTAMGQIFRGPCAVWFRLRYPLIEGEEPSPYQRAAVAADSGNGISAVLDYRLYSFLNSDLTINFVRPAVGEWICLDARTYLGPTGTGLAESTLFDVRGFVGRATQSLGIRKRAT